MKIILASASPRRKELLKLLFTEFEIVPALGEEQNTGNTPDEIVRSLAMQKANEVVSRLGLNSGQGLETLLISADTIVAMDGQILGKPLDKEDAKATLRLLSGRTHQVYTGVTLCHYSNGMEKIHTFSECTEVSFYEMTEQEISDYVATGECMDKAGSYGIQGLAGRYIKGIVGDYNNVVGLPVASIYQELKNHILVSSIINGDEKNV